MSLDLSPFARLPLAHLPTPLERLSALTGDAWGVRLFVKRDDCTGLGFGGNKTRKLEFTLGHALAAGATTLITSGAWQSNHVRQTAAAAARTGLNCHVVISDAVGRETEAYCASGNMLLHGLFGAHLHLAEDDGDATTRCMDRLANEAMARGETPYIVPLGASDGIGSLGYAECARELLAQCEAQSVAPTAIVLATGSGGTHAGLLAGLRLLGSRVRVIGISVSEPADVKFDKVRGIADAMLDLCGASRGTVSDTDIVVLDDYTGPGYAIPTEEANQAIRTLAAREGLLVDPVYTAKALAGLLDLLERGRLTGDVVFLHTGGTPALFAYADEFPLTKATCP
ncbi:D-cysteine desulfhydrase family protein [Sphingomonas colocasiae]|uniref:D-cysteine desulfhydrase family protein n=1 Tax=Sphingomonas colocasiae TaxID=1848973 RepID=A0ABS7PJ06_9SPHN|nr:D-cysteine desulfhydrase family protein [Sphingomonas colocasiae]MBY8821266.1 D-cysteine desulfhydrase family protein [Sphingomonas colocasiae]